MKQILSCVFLIMCLIACTQCDSNVQPGKGGASWSQFRGPNCSGIASPNDQPPTEFGEDNNLLWKINLPVGTSSPVIWNDKIYLTAFVAENKELQTLCIEKATGKILWSNSLFAEKFEKSHPISSPAQSTMAADENGVYVYFASHGVRSFSHKGELRWDFPMPVHESVDYGHASSPVIMDDKVLLSIDFGDDKIRCLMALNKNTGEVIWKTPVYNPTEYHGHSTPIQYHDEVILHRCGAVCAYSLADGSPVWWLQLITEWTEFYNYWKNLTQDLGILALPLGLTGELPMRSILWMQLKKNPEIPSPVVCNESVYMVADGGWLTCMDIKTGEVTFQEKIGVPGPYIASPVAANGNIYAASHNGNVMVITAQKKPVVVFRTQLKGKILATPAIEGNHLYIRTSEHLYAFMNDLKR